MEQAEQWLMERIPQAQTAETWDAFCDSQGPLGNHYRKYLWLKAHWDCIKERGFMTGRPILYPAARKFADLFSEAKMVAQVTMPKGQGTRYPAPQGMVFIGERTGEDTICGHYGGRRGWSEDWLKRGEKIRSHYGGTFYTCYVRLRPELTPPTFPTGQKFRMEPGSFEAIRWDDGRILIVSNAQSFIDSTWVAVLDGTDSLEDLLPVEDREFLARERAAEKAAWETEEEVNQ